MPKLLDLFCGAGGCAMGYHRAGFELVGVDRRPMPRYPFAFVCADALEYAVEHGREFDVIHASPPCQRYSIASVASGTSLNHPDLLGPTREVLESIGRPWIIENVERAPMRPPAVLLCGLMFGLKVFRHRWFESSHLLFASQHPSHGTRKLGIDGMVCVAGHGGASWHGYRGGRRYIASDHRSKASWERAMGIDWMIRDELAQAIPPAYTRYLGLQLIHQIG